jgi:DNA uptake protein ComE-like DNA-binding protein
MMSRRAGIIASILSVLAFLAAAPLFAQGGLLDPNTASESDLQKLPHLTPAIVKDLIAKRPFATIIDFNKFLLGAMLKPDQTREVYRQAFVKINLNTGTKEEFMLIPGVGSRMSGEFMEYRPWKTWAQFDKEIGKYVGQQETDRFKQYVFIPPA